MTRSEGMTPARAQIAPRGRWKHCLYRDNGDGTADILIGAKLYTVPVGLVKPKGER